jgi:hypothetical protein
VEAKCWKRVRKVPATAAGRVAVEQRSGGREDQVGLPADLDLGPLHGLPVCRGPVPVIVGTIVDECPATKSLNQPAGEGKRRQHGESRQTQVRIDPAQSSGNETPVDGEGGPAQAREHGHVDGPHLLADLPQPLYPAGNLLDSAAQSIAVGAWPAEPNGVDPEYSVISAQMFDQVLTTRKVSAPIVGKHNQFVAASLNFHRVAPGLERPCEVWGVPSA